ncbi:CHASE2 domain-containing protein [Coleofasciculus chthonoplastes]|uniref:CHASE2 domain-containing protein n=1 Tax=Coleofasciculus chthonoplastes TaxID=64178 RepID=UPI0018DE8E16|nr:CHASE2 domain-containing protein [Coleofasciculus chthonoplastes]
MSLLVGVGGLELLELRLFDEMVKQSLSSPPSQRIVIVGITQADIQELDHYPISDRVLAQVLSQILAENLVVVGLGLFRDVPVNYGETRRDVPLERLPLERLTIINESVIWRVWDNGIGISESVQKWFRRAIVHLLLVFTLER